MLTKNYAQFKNIEPFFDAITTGLEGFVDGEHFWDCIHDDITYDFRYRYPGLPKIITGKDEMFRVFEGVCDLEVLHGTSDLVIHKTTDPSVIILEFDVQGKSLKSGKPHENRNCIVLTIKNRKIIYWRDYMDSFSAFVTHDAEYSDKKTK